MIYYVTRLVRAVGLWVPEFECVGYSVLRTCAVFQFGVIEFDVINLLLSNLMLSNLVLSNLVLLNLKQRIEFAMKE